MSDPSHSVNVSFSKPIDPTTFTVADLVLTRNGQPVTLDPAVVTITTTDNKTFHVGGLTTYTTPIGAYVLTVNGAGIMDIAGNAVSNNQTLSFSVVTTLDSGPQVVSVQRFGFHAQPTSIVITFNQDLNPTSASNVNAYEIWAPGHDRQPGTADDVMVPIASATYDAATRTVTLLPVHQLYLFDEYMLIVKGTGAERDRRRERCRTRWQGQRAARQRLHDRLRPAEPGRPGADQRQQSNPNAGQGDTEAEPDADEPDQTLAGDHQFRQSLQESRPRDREAFEQSASSTAHDPKK